MTFLEKFYNYLDDSFIFRKNLQLFFDFLEFGLERDDTRPAVHQMPATYSKQRPKGCNKKFSRLVDLYWNILTSLTNWHHELFSKTKFAQYKWTKLQIQI